MNYLDLFAGIGGFALGAEWAALRWDHHYFSEVDEYAIEVYKKRFPHAIGLGDTREIDGGRLLADAERNEIRVESGRRNGKNRTNEGVPRQHGGQWLISGGFPCQDISVAGKGAGINAKRSGLWFEYARLIDEIRPAYAIVENVGALARRGLKEVLGSLTEIGYDAEWSDIRASDVGAPHRRERIWIVAYPSSGRWSVPRSSDKKVSYRVAASEWAHKATPFRGLGSIEGKREWWNAEPDVGRVAHGVPSRVDRLKCIGNSIVPQIAQAIFASLEMVE